MPPSSDSSNTGSNTRLTAGKTTMPIRPALKSESKSDSAGSHPHGQRTQRRVTFQSTPPTVATIPHSSDYTQEEFHDTWYTRDEYAKIMRETQDVVVTYMYLMQHQQYQHLKKLTMRGLESTFGNESQLKSQRRMQQLHAILTVQQHVQSDADAENMANMCLKLSAAGVGEAIMRGKRDRDEEIRMRGMHGSSLRTVSS